MEDFYDFNDTDYLNTSSSMKPCVGLSPLENHTMFLGLFPEIANKTSVIVGIMICIGLPLTLLAIYRLYSLVRDGHVVPVFVINLLISDFIQICCLMIWVVGPEIHIINVSKCIYYIGMLASVGFMMCVALTRYFSVACPMWYRFKRSIKFSVLVSVMVWVLCVIEFLVLLLISDFVLTFHCIFLLLPFPVLIFCLIGIIKSLSSAISVTPEEKWQIIGTLVLAVMNYTLLFLPWIICLLSNRDSGDVLCDSNLYLSLRWFSPLVDLILYIFMSKGTVDKLLAFLCYCRMKREEEQSQVTTDEVNSQ